MCLAAPVERGGELMPGECQAPHQRGRLGIRGVVCQGAGQQCLNLGVIGWIAHLADLLEVGAGQEVDRLPIVRLAFEFRLRLGDDIVGPLRDCTVNPTRAGRSGLVTARREHAGCQRHRRQSHRASHGSSLGWATGPRVEPRLSDRYGACGSATYGKLAWNGTSLARTPSPTSGTDPARHGF